MKNSRLLKGIMLITAVWIFKPIVAPAQSQLKTLVITGAAPYGYHPWEQNIELIEPRLEAFDVTTVDYHIAHGLEDWRKWDGNYSDYDAILIIYYWAQAPQAELKKLDKYVRNGGALVIAHSALAGFWQQPIFDEWAGMAYRERDAWYGHNLAFNKNGERFIRPPGEGGGSAHAPIDTFKIYTHNPEHPIMQGLPAEWMQADDELYYNLRGPNTNLNVLATALDPEGNFAPQAWTRNHGEGRIFCVTPGHHKPGASSVGFITLLARGIEWTATGKVTTPVPTNFPGEHSPSTALPTFE